jgi:hypothetical protein
VVRSATLPQVTVHVTRGSNTTLEHYCVLALYSKHYNKWYLHWDDDKVKFERGSKKFKILGRTVIKDGSSWKEIELVKDGKWSPKSVFSIKSMSDVVSVLLTSNSFYIMSNIACSCVMRLVLIRHVRHSECYTWIRAQHCLFVRSSTNFIIFQSALDQ